MKRLEIQGKSQAKATENGRLRILKLLNLIFVVSLCLSTGAGFIANSRKEAGC